VSAPAGFTCPDCGAADFELQLGGRASGVITCRGCGGTFAPQPEADPAARWADTITSSRPDDELSASVTCPKQHRTALAAYVCGAASLRRLAAVTRDGAPRRGVFDHLALDVREVAR